jgi:hypothetical protein
MAYYDILIVLFYGIFYVVNILSYLYAMILRCCRVNAIAQSYPVYLLYRTGD